MRNWKVGVPLFLLCSIAFASESRLPFGTVFKGQDQFNRLVATAKAGNWKALPIGERTAAVGQALERAHVRVGVVRKPAGNEFHIDVYATVQHDVRGLRLCQRGSQQARDGDSDKLLVHGVSPLADKIGKIIV